MVAGSLRGLYRNMQRARSGRHRSRPKLDRRTTTQVGRRRFCDPCGRCQHLCFPDNRHGASYDAWLSCGLGRGHALNRSRPMARTMTRNRPQRRLGGYGPRTSGRRANEARVGFAVGPGGGHPARRRRRRRGGDRQHRGGRSRSGHRRRIGNSRRRLRLGGLCGRGRRRRSVGMRMRRDGRRRRRRRRLGRVGWAVGGRRRSGIGSDAHRQQRERVDVSLLVGGHADAEVDVRLGPIGLATRPDRGHRGSLRHGVALANEEGAEMLERDCVPVCSPDRECLASLRHGPGEGDGSRCGSTDVGIEISGNVDPAVLAAGVRIASEDERPEHLSVYGPGPRLGSGRNEPGEDEYEQNHPPHASTPCSRD